MYLGILSDTHGHLARTKSAINTLLSEGCKTIIHCGDLGSEAILMELSAAFQPLDIPVYAVTGNVDLWDKSILDYPPNCGVDLKRHHELLIGGRRIAVVHGDDERLFKQLTRGDFELVFTGHTHEAADTQIGSTRIINPGAVHNTASPSVARFDLETDLLQHLPLPAV